MNLHQALFAKRFLGFPVLATAVFFRVFTCLAQTNSWTGPVSGNWQDSTWSLGIPPAASQSVMITNAGFKAVGIFPATATNFPATMTVSNLTISAPDNSKNTLLLNYSGTAVPLEVLSNCMIGSNGTLLSLYSSLQIGSYFTIITNGSFVQQGGVTIVSNQFASSGGTVALTNATFSCSNAFFDNFTTFNQSGGSVSGSFWQIESGTINLFDGLLSAPLYFGEFGTGYLNQYGGQITGGLHIFDGTVSQYGGTVSNASIEVGTFVEGIADYSLYGGVVTNSAIIVNNGSFEQSGGQATIGGLDVYGFFDDYGPLFFANCGLSGGYLTCGSISLGILGSMGQSNGTNSVIGDLDYNEGNYSLSGGLLAVSNTIMGPGGFPEPDAFFGTGFSQSGGVHRITNQLSCAGGYNLDGGTLIAPAVVLQGLIEFGAGGVISNTTSFELDGTIQFNNSTQHLAATVLAGNSIINFNSGSNRLTFANSSAHAWTNTAILSVSNWNGSVSGGGVDQLIFGNTINGLTPAQVQQIEFVNPAGFGPGIWSAKILPTGEIVPTSVLPLFVTSSGSNVVVQWPGTYVLQTATNLPGPFQDISASSPYTNNTSQFPQRFFRLRQ